MNIKEILVWDGSRYRKIIGKVMTSVGLKDFYRPIDVKDDFSTRFGMVLESTSGVIKERKLWFDTLINYDVWQINDNLIPFENPIAWGTGNVINRGDYFEVNSGNSVAAWGLVTDRGIGLDFSHNQEYTISFEIKSEELEVLSYNYIISSDGNARTDNIPINKPQEWTKFSLTFNSTDKDRSNAGILLGADLRNQNGNSYLIKNVKIEVGTMAT